MKKSTFLTAAVFTILIIVSFATELNAQNEFRIKQAIPTDIDSLYIASGWQVRINQANEASVTIVTPCSAYFNNESEPEVCKIENSTLTMLENSTMPKNTTLEITLTKMPHYIEIGEDATVTTGILTFLDRQSDVEIKERATVNGAQWRSSRSLFISINPDASLKLDSIVAGKYLSIRQSEDAFFDCPAMVSPESKLYRHKKAKGPIYESDSTKHLTVKTRWYLSREKQSLTVNGGIKAPIPLYMNNKQGSPYNRGENYSINLQMQVIRIKLTDKLSYTPALRYEWEWSRLLNTVAKDGNALVLDASHGALIPQQHLLAQNIGLDYNFVYNIGKKNETTGMSPVHLDFGLSVMYNISGRLATRVMDDNNRWQRTNEKVDVFNPWQLRTHVGIGGGPLTRATLSLTYDLLPTFRSGIGADKLHTFGVSINF